MDKNKLINYLKSRSQIQFKGIVRPYKKEEQEVVKREKEEEKSDGDFDVELLISTNSESPIQKGFFGDWKEIIADGCFDEALNRDVFSFLDHEVKISHILASTKSNTLKLEKTGEGYVAKLKLDKTKEMAVDLLEKIKRGDVTENSFIFIPQETEYNKEASDVDVVVIHKRGELLSVDPVALAFYPQNQINLINTEEEIVEQKNKKLLREEEVDVDVESDSDIDYKKKYEELLEELKTYKDAKEEEDQVDGETQPPTRTNDGEKVNSEENGKNDSKEEVEKTKEEKEEEEEKKEERNKKTNYIKSLRGAVNMVNKPTLKDIEKKFLRNKSFVRNSGFYTDEEKEVLREYIQRNINTSEDPDTYSHSLNLLTEGVLQKRDINGTSYDTGLAYISIIDDPEVKTEFEKVMKEIIGAEFVAVETLDEVKKNFIIPTAVVPSQLAEGASSPNLDGTTISVVLESKRYSSEYVVNPALANASQTLEKNALQGKNALITSIRTDTWSNIFQHQGEELAALPNGAYKGGITRDALVATQSTSVFSITDLDILIDNAESIYGDDVYKYFVLFVHPQTKSFILNQSRKLYNAPWVTDKDGFKYREVPVVSIPQFPNKVTDLETGAASGLIALWVRKDCIIVRGGNFVVQDNPYARMSENLLTRYVWTRMDVKLIDPYINTRGLYVGTIPSDITTARIAAIQSVAEGETLLAQATDTATKKAIQARIDELTA